MVDMESAMYYMVKKEMLAKPDFNSEEEYAMRGLIRIIREFQLKHEMLNSL